MSKKYQLTSYRKAYLPGPKVGEIYKPCQFLGTGDSKGVFSTKDKDQIEYLDGLSSNVANGGTLFEAVKEAAKPKKEEPQKKKEEVPTTTDTDVVLDPDVEKKFEGVTNFQQARIAVKQVNPEFTGRSEASVIEEADRLNMNFPNWEK